MHDDDLNLAVLATCHLCFPRYLPVVDSGKDTGENEVVLGCEKIDGEASKEKDRGDEHETKEDEEEFYLTFVFRKSFALDHGASCTNFLLHSFTLVLKCREQTGDVISSSQIVLLDCYKVKFN